MSTSACRWGAGCLATSIVRRNFTDEGKIRADCLVPFVEELRGLAAEKKVPLMDLYSLTLNRLSRAGASDELGL
jgi:hypothetical protein